MTEVPPHVRELLMKYAQPPPLSKAHKRRLWRLLAWLRRMR